MNNNNNVNNNVVNSNVPINQETNNGTYLNLSNISYRNNGDSNLKSNLLLEEEMNEERKAYLLEKEEKIRKRKKQKKIISRTILIIVVLFVVCYGYKYYFRPVKIDERIDKNSIHYLTDLYYSDGRYYEEYLDEKGKEVYLTIFNDLKNVEATTSIDCTDYGYTTKSGCATVVDTSLEIIFLEHPDMFWYRYSSYRYGENYGIEMKHHYVSTTKIELFLVEKRLLRKIDEVASQYEDMSDYEKIKSVYTWLGANKSYSDGVIRTRKDGTAWSALLDDDTVCAGYADASQLLFQRLGIESIRVSGSVDGEGHAWNFVSLDGEYYWYDATVGGSVGYDSPYFYKGFLFQSHSSYAVDVLNLEKYTWGEKYLES